MPYASPADTTEFGTYSFVRDDRPLYRFDGRIENRPGTEHPAEAGRYHLYAGWFCPWSHRSTLVVALAGIGDAVSVSYVHGDRDGRGWAFREATGPDPVNGFTVLREAYEATEPGFDGHISVPTLWDRPTARVLSNNYAAIDIDLATQFSAYAQGGIDLYPADLAEDIVGIDGWLGPAINHGIGAAIANDETGKAARDRFNATLGKLEAKLADERFLLGDRLTLADLRLLVTLVRFDAGPNASEAIGPRLDTYPHLWGWARSLYRRPEVASTVDFSSFSEPDAPELDWDAPVTR